MRAARDYANTRFPPRGGRHDTLYVVMPYPNILYALDLTKPGAPVEWKFRGGGCRPEVRLRILSYDPRPRRRNGLVGPPLERLRRRSYVAGHLANNPDTLVAWIRHPHSFTRVTQMPEMGVGEQEARDIAAYLYTLQ